MPKIEDRIADQIENPIEVLAGFEPEVYSLFPIRGMDAKVRLAYEILNREWEQRPYSRQHDQLREAESLMVGAVENIAQHAQGDYLGFLKQMGQGTLRAIESGGIDLREIYVDCYNALVAVESYKELETAHPDKAEEALTNAKALMEKAIFALEPRQGLARAS